MKFQVLLLFSTASSCVIWFIYLSFFYFLNSVSKTMVYSSMDLWASCKVLLFQIFCLPACLPWRIKVSRDPQSCEKHSGCFANCLQAAPACNLCLKQEGGGGKQTQGRKWRNCLNIFFFKEINLARVVFAEYFFTAWKLHRMKWT